MIHGLLMPGHPNHGFAVFFRLPHNEGEIVRAGDEPLVNAASELLISLCGDAVPVLLRVGVELALLVVAAGPEGVVGVEGHGVDPVRLKIT
jgi:hypothetical protein